MSVLQQVLQRSGERCVDNFDAGLANKWRWEWLEKTVTIGVKKSHLKITWTSSDPLVILLKYCIRKKKQPGKAICTVCCKSDSDVITYSTLKQHIMGKGHVLKVITKMQCYKLPGAPSAKSYENYGSPPAYYRAPAANTNPPPPLQIV